MKRLFFFILVAAVMSVSACSCSGLPVDVSSDIQDEIRPDLPPLADAERISTDVTVALIEAFDAAIADETMTLMEALDAAMDATTAGLKAGNVWSRRVAHDTQLTVGAVFTMARSTATTVIMARGVADLVLYDKDSPHAGLGNELAKKLGELVKASFDGGYVTVGEVVTWPLALTKEALDMTGISERVVGTASGATAPTTVGALYTLGVVLTETTLTTLRLWDVILWRTK